MLHVARLKLIQDFSHEIVIGNLIATKNYSKSLFQPSSNNKRIYESTNKDRVHMFFNINCKRGYFIYLIESIFYKIQYVGKA